MFPHIQKKIDRITALGMVATCSIGGGSTNALVGGSTCKIEGIPKLHHKDNYMYCEDTGVYYTIDRNYIGTKPVLAVLQLLDVIEPELAQAEDVVCSVGYSRFLESWVHWSMHGLSIHRCREDAAEFGKMLGEFNINLDFEYNVDKLFAQRFLTSPSMTRILETIATRLQNPTVTETQTVDPEIKEICDQEEATPMWRRVEALRQRRAETPEQFDEVIRRARLPAAPENEVFNEMFGDLVSLFEQKSAPQPVQVRTAGGPYHSDHGKISGEHKQHNVDSNKSVFNNRRQSGDHIQHGVPTDAKPTIPTKPQMNRSKISGEHIQQGHPNPPTLYVTSSELKSESSDTVHDYIWMRYSPANGRSRHFNNHHRQHEMSLDMNEVFGYRAVRGGEFYVVFEDNRNIKFKLSAKEMESVLKVCKPFRGKIEGQVVQRKEVPLPKLSTDRPLTPKEKQKLAELEAAKKKVEPKLKNSVIGGDGKIDLSRVSREETLSRDTTYVGFFQSSAFADDFDVFMDDDKEDLEDELLDAMRRTKNGIPVSYVMKVKTTLPWVRSLLGTSGKMRLHTQVAQRILATQKHEKLEAGINIEHFKERPEQPNSGKFKRKEPLYYGNSFAVLSEVKQAILSGHFTKAFRITQITGKSSINIDNKLAAQDPSFGIVSNDPSNDDFMLVLAAQNDNPLYQHEAEEIQGRLARVYGPALKSIVKHTKTSQNGSGVLFVVIKLNLARRPDVDIARSRKLHELVKNILENKQGVAKKSLAESELLKLSDQMTALRKTSAADASILKDKFETQRTTLKNSIIRARTIANQRTVNPAGSARAAKDLIRHQSALQGLDQEYEFELTNLERKTEEAVAKIQNKIDAMTSAKDFRYSSELVLNVPIYSIKTSTGNFVSVEAVDYSIPDGTIGVRTVRGKDRTVTQVKELYTFNGHTKVFP